MRINDCLKKINKFVNFPNCKFPKISEVVKFLKLANFQISKICKTMKIRNTSNLVNYHVCILSVRRSQKKVNIKNKFKNRII